MAAFRACACKLSWTLLFDRPGSAPIWGGKKGEFRDWTSVYLVSLDYEISLPHPSPYHTSQQAADLVFEPSLKRSQKREKSNFKRNFLAKPSKREKITLQS